MKGVGARGNTEGSETGNTRDGGTLGIREAEGHTEGRGTLAGNTRGGETRDNSDGGALGGGALGNTRGGGTPGKTRGAGALGGETRATARIIGTGEGEKEARG